MMMTIRGKKDICIPDHFFRLSFPFPSRVVVAPVLFNVALDPQECGNLCQSITLLEEVRKTRVTRESLSPFPTKVDKKKMRGGMKEERRVKPPL